MKRRILLLAWVMVLLLTLSGCAQIASLITPEAPSPTRPTVTMTPAPTLQNEPALLYRGVETDQRVISLIFEGFTDSDTMNQLIDVLAARKVACVFFVSGLTATEETDTIRRIKEAGFEIGNYGITAQKNMQDDTIEENMHQFTLGQELLSQTCGVTPELFRCNGTEYTRQVLQAAAASGLTAGVEPTAYLNHHSFSAGTDATAFVQRLVRGSIISVKLGQELDAAEYGSVTDTNGERPAIDPSPSIADEADEMLLVPFKDIVPGVTWLLDALDSEGYTIVAPGELSRYEVNLLGDPVTLDDAVLTLLNDAAYAVPVTKDLLLSGMERTDAGSLDGCVLVGDSVANSIAGYVTWQRQTQPDYLAGLQFLIGDRLTVENSLMKVSGTSAHPIYENVKGTVEDTLRRMNAKRVYLMLQCSDPKLYSGEYPLSNYKLLLYLIRKQNPGIEIVILPVPPHVATSSETLTNRQVFRFDLELARMCMQYNIAFLDTASGLRDATGALNMAYCIDPDTYGTHLNDDGCEQFIQSMSGYAPVGTKLTAEEAQTHETQDEIAQ